MHGVTQRVDGGGCSCTVDERVVRFACNRQGASVSVLVTSLVASRSTHILLLTTLQSLAGLAWLDALCCSLLFPALGTSVRMCTAACLCCVVSDLERVSLDACDECVRELVLVGALIERLHHHSLAASIATGQHDDNLARLDAEHSRTPQSGQDRRSACQ